MSSYPPTSPPLCPQRSGNFATGLFCTTGDKLLATLPGPRPGPGASGVRRDRSGQSDEQHNASQGQPVITPNQRQVAGQVRRLLLSRAGDHAVLRARPVVIVACRTAEAPGPPGVQPGEAEEIPAQKKGARIRQHVYPSRRAHWVSHILTAGRAVPPSICRISRRNMTIWRTTPDMIGQCWRRWRATGRRAGCLCSWPSTAAMPMLWFVQSRQ